MDTEKRPENEQPGTPAKQEEAGKAPEAPAEVPRDGLGRFVPGHSGNPTGSRKTHINLKQLIERVLLDADPHDAQRPVVERFVKSLIANAMRGNGTAITQVCDRVAGKVTERVEIRRADDWLEEFSPVEEEAPEEAPESELQRCHRRALAELPPQAAEPEEAGDA